MFTIIYNYKMLGKNEQTERNWKLYRQLSKGFADKSNNVSGS